MKRGGEKQLRKDFTALGPKEVKSYTLPNGVSILMPKKKHNASTWQNKRKLVAYDYKKKSSIFEMFIPYNKM